MPLNYKQTCQRLIKAGFHFYRNAKGSHELWKNLEGKVILISNHGNINIPKGTLTKIAKSAGFKNLKEFQNFK